MNKINATKLDSDSQAIDVLLKKLIYAVTNVLRFNNKYRALFKILKRNSSHALMNPNQIGVWTLIAMATARLDCMDS